MARDQDEFTSFAVAAAPRLRRAAYALCRDWSDADDAVQETLAKVARVWHRLDSRDPYFYSRKVLSRVLISESRRLWRRREVASGLKIIQPNDSSSHDHCDSLLAALQDLSPTQRGVVVLRYAEDFSVAETARLLNCSEGNVKRVASDARKRLRLHLEIGSANERKRSE